MRAGIELGRWLLVSILVSGAGLLAGCGGATDENPSDGKLTLGYVGWDESVAISNLTKVLLEEELGYVEVELRKGSPESVFRGVGSGELDAFQDVWLPHHKPLLEEAGGDVGLLLPWLVGTTRSSLAVPDYMGVRTVEQLGSIGEPRIVGLEPEAAPMGEIPYGAVVEPPPEGSTYPSTAGMLAEADRLYEAREPFVFVAWSPHWMNLRYDFEYLEDPEGVLGDVTQPARPYTVVREDLAQEEPVARALMDALEFTDYRISSLELEIQDAKTPEKGARSWIQEHEKLTEAWVESTEERAGLE
jgi:glycine betaine/proline transport system substrate-binding protein